MSKKIKYLVVDTTAFIKAENLLNIADNVYTVQEVIDEITNDRQRRKLVVLPYDINVKDVFTENIKFVTDFSKKTGDYTSLSATDIKVIALTYQLEKEKVGTEHLKSEPTMQKTIKVSGLSNFNLHPESKDNVENKEEKEFPDNNEANSSDVEKSNENLLKQNETLECENKFSVNTEEKEKELAEDIAEQIKNIDLKDDSELNNVMVKVSDEEEDSESEDETDSDGEEWITPSNLAQKKKDMEMGEFEEKNVEVACITSDFAMQNVLKQIGLNVTAIDGRIIRQLRTFIFRCTTCFKTTSVMTKLFCSKCGHATLKKVAVSVDDEGNQHIHINGRKPLTARGKRFSLPTPKGGQHFQYPILTEDQHIHKRFATKLARKKTNAMDPDYIAGFSPFAMKDVNSKSAVLGIRADKQDVKYWMKNYSKGKK
ncbi:PREDICTED: RNA-binding protein NOB1 [Papilio xuthus]|uniref:RNA-binding protein NOB1 n=1 Tax=Papilio xuthus TaxID=66420 RepID=A0AAJ7EEH2_PAPXU|nr:PREDICTED: RNA-binding protein NOB1 [Papilio xuthus]